MTKRYKILRKKLKELKAALIYVFSIPESESNPPYQHHQLLSEEIEQRFLFLKNLLSAEISSSPSKPHHLQHIAHRLEDWETAFREWDDHRRNRSADHVNDFDDDASECSCDDSWRDDDGEAYDNKDHDDVKKMPEDEEGLSTSFLSGERRLVEVNVELQDSVLMEKINENYDDGDRGDNMAHMMSGSSRKQQEKGKRSFYGGGLVVSGMIFGGALTALIMSRFCSDTFYFAVPQSFLVPT